MNNYIINKLISNYLHNNQSLFMLQNIFGIKFNNVFPIDNDHSLTKYLKI